MTGKNLLQIALILSLTIFLTACLGISGQDTVTDIEQTIEPSETGSPDWYINPFYPPQETRIIRGYGRGASPEQARLNALEDISRQLGVTIHSEAQDLTMEFVQEQQQQITEEYTHRVRAEATHHLKDWRLEKSKQVGDQHYAIIILDRRAAPVVVAEKIKNSLRIQPGSVKWIGPRSLINGNIIPKIESTLLRKGGEQATVELNLQRRDEQWYLVVRPEESEPFHVALDEPDFPRLFGLPVKNANNLVQLSLRPLDILRGYNRLREGDWFIFEIAAQTEGHITLFNIYEDGRVSILDENLQIQPGSNREIPSQKEQAAGEAFMAFPIEHNQPTQDLYLAILSSTPLPTSGFQRLLEESPPLAGETSYQIHRLMEWLDEHQANIQDLDVISVLIQP